MTDPTRAPFDETDFARRCPAGWQLTAVVETGSTNADLLAAAATGAADRTVLLAHLQSGGRGRLERSWVSPAGAGLTFSFLLRPAVPPAGWGWLSLLTGLALSATIGAQASLKWPNDVLLGPAGGKVAGGKVAGILAQAAGPAVVIGVGLNVSTTTAELPVPTATSLAIQGHSTLRRPELLAGFLARFDELYTDWQASSGDAEASGLAAAYRAGCATLDQRVSVQLPDGTVHGAATGIDPAGRLVIQPADGGPAVAVAVGDVTHVRPFSR
ncbi:MAG: biotin--[acetyl-CoA-carboxylase] ligase [Actinomycetota bacterium]|nr:biotin--[acetyl-CoA-carboxylase] ligase [Actinomycetota bacterium]MDQ2957458.1 biotin--[acetyl-CoA-carboxylase] ligase [Actinomycetota bacterium]